MINNQMILKPIFISHAVASKQLADKLVDLLETGIGITDKDIFCSSLEGLGIPSGTNFVEFIRQQIKDPKVVILLLTAEYFNSQFCLCELGASWVLAHTIIPLLVFPLEYKDVKAVLTGIHVLKLGDKNDLNNMQDELVKALGIEGKPFARWEVKRDKFLKDLQEYLSSMKPSKAISTDQYRELEKKYSEALKELTKSEEENEKKAEIINKLKKLKNAREVKKVFEESLDSIANFERLVRNAKDAVKNLPNIVIEAIYYHFRNEFLEWPGFGSDYKIDQIKRAIEEDYFYDEGNGVSVVEDDPKIAKAIKKLGELKSFINRLNDDFDKKSEDFYEYYENTYGHKLNFTSRRFWDTHLF